MVPESKCPGACFFFVATSIMLSTRVVVVFFFKKKKSLLLLWQQQQHFTTIRQQGIVYPENRMHVYLQCKRRHRRHVSHGMHVSYSIGWGNGSRGNVFSYDCDVWGKVLCAINQLVCGATSQL